MQKRLRGPERRELILRKAAGLFADRGFHGVSIDDIADAVGVSPAALYRYFASKEALYEAVLDDLSCTREDYIETVLSPASDFPTVLRGLVQVFVRGMARQPDLLKMELHSLLEGHAAAEAFFEHRWKTFTDYIEYSLQELRREGRLGRGPDPRLCALMFQGMVREVLIAKCLPAGERFDDRGLDELVDGLVDLFLRAVGYPAA
ncbi:TetR/AcrR family transcriptional regulator [Acidihalobacter aeolianus]|uniref:TetR/AcrR family transcriptional regulator n=1 Tax=Acidihalobacter aeolianus TaxID=2792603 RepID=UPI0012EA6FB3